MKRIIILVFCLMLFSCKEYNNYEITLKKNNKTIILYRTLSKESASTIKIEQTVNKSEVLYFNGQHYEQIYFSKEPIQLINIKNK